MLPSGPLRDQDVARLDVAMDETALVRCVECVADLVDEPECTLRVEGALAGDQLPEVVALDVPHREVQLPVGVAGGVDRDDVRVIERGGNLRLAEEPVAEAIALCELRHEELEGNLAPEASVLGTVDRSHSPSPEQCLQPEAGDLAPGEWIRPDRQSAPLLPAEENTGMARTMRVGDYTLEQELGRGAAGIVYRARSADGRVVALKTFDPAAVDEAFRARLAREIRLARELDEPHLVRILEAGEDAGAPYLVLEYVPGGSLADRLVGGPLGLDEALDVVASVAAGLGALHRGGIVHRDVKPSNVMFREDGSAALTDFGLAKGTADTVLTRPGQLLGTLDYVAPELLRGGEATQASDIYALGCVAYECLAGRPPFADRSLLGVGRAHLEDEPPEPPVSAAVSRVLLLALAKDPAERPPTAAMYAHLLRAAERG